MNRYSVGFYIVLIVTLFSGCSTKKVDCQKELVFELNSETMSLIKGGSFLMGDYNDSFGDKPPIVVKVDSFYIDRTEVTNAEYRAYTEAVECSRKPKFIDDPILGEDSLPVVAVSHREAEGFCKYYGKRLPTEAEWEYAARGGLERKKFPWGNEESSDFMNFRDSKSSWSKPVKSYIQNDYYLYDMTGNVREWVADSYEKDFYLNSCSKLGVFSFACHINPVNENPLIKYRVNRGGSWRYSEGYPADVSSRTFDDKNYKGDDLGFRCAKEANSNDSWVVEKIKGLIDG